LKLGYERFEYAHSKLESSMSTGVDLSRLKVYTETTSYRVKMTDECIKEGIYQAFAIRFFGALVEGEWFLFTQLVFFGDQLDEQNAKKVIAADLDKVDFWDIGLFRSSGMQNISPSSSDVLRDVELEEFGNIPYLVSVIKQRKKKAVNGAFSRYMNEAVFMPFIRQLKIFFPDEFVGVFPLYDDDYTLIFPQSKKCALMVAMAKDSKSLFNLIYFFYDVHERKVYRWTYPKPINYSSLHAYSQDIINDLEVISDWNNYQFLNSSRTLDDPYFWENFVTKRENGFYKFLVEVQFPK
jgi:hypothetical protein